MNEITTHKLLTLLLGLLPWLTGTRCHGYTMDGNLDSPNYLISDNGMRIWAATQGSKLYFATWSSVGGTSDHFLLVSKDFGDPTAHPWNKQGNVNFYFGGWPWLAAEGDPAGSPFFTLNNGGASGRRAMGANGKVLEGEIDLVEVFGHIPPVIYLSAIAYGDGDGASISAQCPAAWDVDSNLQTTEFAAINTASIRDEDGDGYHDAGRPTFESIAGTSTMDANYGLRRFFLDETVPGDEDSLLFKFLPNRNPSETVSQVQLITNLNRRDHAVIEESRNLATTTSNTYYRAYPMMLINGAWQLSLPVSKCGVYRATVRYYVDGVGPYYYTDGAERRDLAIVVSPRKALEMTLYEVNPLTVEATAATQAGRSTFRDLWMQNTDRPDVMNLNHFTSLGINMLWLQPVHPIGVEARGTEPSNGQPYTPGSPYAVRDYWTINPLLGAANTATAAMTEFQTAVAELDAKGVGVMMDGTFNHCSPDAIFGQGAADIFPWGTAAAASQIRNARPQWFSKATDYGLPATTAAEIALSPDRSNITKWQDVRELYFGNYDTLVNYASASHRDEYLLERDTLQPLSNDTKEVWEYFAYYPLYWLEKTGYPAGTHATETEKGIDGLRCDFAQGLPSQFWEYCINKTRSRKWNFVFMAESLDGYKEVAGNKRHGVSYRSARQFDVLNENFVFHWRDTHFAYPVNGAGSGGAKNRSTGATSNAYNLRREAFEGVPLLLNLTSHDEILPSNNGYELLYAHAQLCALDGLPMMFFGQEAGVQNDVANYGFSGIANGNHNFASYELNFGKYIPHFKKWNTMTNIWQNRDWTLQGLYSRVNKARLASPALRERENYFLSRTGGLGMDSSIFAVAKYQVPTLSVSQQDVVFCFVNTDYVANANRTATFDVSPTTLGANRFGIQNGHFYNVRNLLATNPNSFLWTTPRSGADLIANGITVILNTAANTLGQAQYLKLVDTSTPQDTDDDGMPDDFELTYAFNSQNPLDANADADGDHQTNFQEFQAGTNPQDANSLLAITQTQRLNDTLTLTWSSVSGKNYQVRASTDLVNWQPASTSIAATSSQTSWGVTIDDQRHFYKIELIP